jgi:hypothetical protein
MAITTQDTSFTHDILGRYVCNTFGEAKASAFDVIIIGGGTFGLTLAQDLFERSQHGDAFLGAILEGPSKGTVRPVVEVSTKTNLARSKRSQVWWA